MRRWLPLTLALLLLPVAAPVYACLNDRDSDALVNEGKNLPDVVQVITGRFERNPPLFYEMRIQREIQSIKNGPDDPTSLPYLYDDVAVAYDRLGKDDEAINWIERKRKLIPEFARKYPSFVDKARLNDLWYRYHANCGTFWAHHWLRAGAKPERIFEMETARQHIAEALKINPNAHFGRERFQLRAMEWILAIRKPGADFTKDPHLKSLAAYLFDEREGKNGTAPLEDPTAAVEGLSGLVVLGNAWESVDVFDALADALDWTGKRHISNLATLRVGELLRQGHKSLSADFSAHEEPINETEDVERKYEELRKEADAWQKARTDYMFPRLKKGFHPDVDDGRNEAHPDFWREFPKTDLPSLEMPWLKRLSGNRGQIGVYVSVGFGILAIALASGLLYAGIRLTVRLVRYLGMRFRRPS